MLGHTGMCGEQLGASGIQAGQRMDRGHISSRSLRVSKTVCRTAGCLEEASNNRRRLLSRVWTRCDLSTKWLTGASLKTTAHLTVVAVPAEYQKPSARSLRDVLRPRGMRQDSGGAGKTEESGSQFPATLLSLESYLRCQLL